MTRSLDTDLQTSAESAEFSYAVFVDCAFKTGNVRLHNGVGTYTFGGNEYYGVGTFGTIDALEESTNIVDNPIKLTLSSIPQEIIDDITTQDTYKNDVDIYIGHIDREGRLQGTPTNWISGYMEGTELNIGEQNALVITVQSRAARLKLRNNKRYTLEDHQADYPGDLFLEWLHFVLEADVIWAGEHVRSGFKSYDGIGGGTIRNPDANRHNRLRD